MFNLCDMNQSEMYSAQIYPFDRDDETEKVLENVQCIYIFPHAIVDGNVSGQFIILIKDSKV